MGICLCIVLKRHHYFALLYIVRRYTAVIAGAAATLANPLDSQALAEGLYTLLTDADLRASQRQRGLARAAEFSWPRAAAETAALYRQVMTA